MFQTDKDVEKVNKINRVHFPFQLGFLHGVQKGDREQSTGMGCPLS